MWAWYTLNPSCVYCGMGEEISNERVQVRVYTVETKKTISIPFTVSVPFRFAHRSVLPFYHFASIFLRVVDCSWPCSML